MLTVQCKSTKKKRLKRKKERKKTIICLCSFSFLLTLNGSQLVGRTPKVGHRPSLDGSQMGGQKPEIMFNEHLMLDMSFKFELLSGQVAKRKYEPRTPQKWVKIWGPREHVGPRARGVENRWPSPLLLLMEMILFIVFILWNKPHHLPLDQHRLQKWICTLSGATASTGSTLSSCCRLHLCSNKVNSYCGKFTRKFYCCS